MRAVWAALAAGARKRRLVRLWAMLLSLAVPGLGHAYLGFLGRSAALLGAATLWSLLYYASPWVAAAVPGAAPTVVALLAAGVALSLGAAADAFRLARGGRGARPRPVVRWLAYAACVAVPSVPDLVAPLDWVQYSIPSGSMLPTFLIGDHVLAIDGYYRRFAPQRGDLATFDVGGVIFVKRIVGLPGDRIEVRDDAAVIDGAPAPLQPLDPVREDPPACGPGLYPRYLERLPGGERHPILLGCGPGMLRSMAALEVPPGRYFMLGDNRDNSEDSRDPVGGVGLVPAEALVARPVFVLYSLDGAGRLLHLPFAFRWERTALALE